MSADLHSRIASELAHRLALAQSVMGHQLFDGTGIVTMSPPNHPRSTVVLPSHVAIFARVHGPADAILRYSSALRVLERHRRYIVPEGYGALSGKPNCAVCNGHVYPCNEIADLAASLGLDTEGSTTDG